MFDFAWTQIGLIGVVALVLIGPKDLPIAIKTVAGLVKKARRMAGEFQSHVDEMVKDTELADIRNQISEIRNFDIRGEVARAVDADGSLRAALREDPLATPPNRATPSLVTGGTEAEAGSVSIAPREPELFKAPPAYQPPAAGPPAFVPPQYVPPTPVAVVRPTEAGPPAFIPPAYVPPGEALTPAAAPPASTV